MYKWFFYIFCISGSENVLILYIINIELTWQNSGEEFIFELCSFFSSNYVKYDKRWLFI